MSKIFCFGELMLRMSPVLGGKWIHEASMPVYVGGAEVNVANALASWEQPVKYATALPGHYLSTEIINDLQSRNIDTSAIHVSGDRIGVYFLPPGADLKNAGVIYDRAHSSFAGLKTGVLDWDAMLDGCSWFHFSAISPALNADVAEVCLEGVRAASAKGLKISVDLNYRAKLWKYGAAPTEVMPALAGYCDVIMGNIWAVESLLGLPSGLASSQGKSRQELASAATSNIEALKKLYPKTATIAYTFRLQKEYFGVLDHLQETVVSKSFGIEQVIDGAGSGDCFMAGLIYGISNHMPLQQVINFAAAAASGKLMEHGDATKQLVSDIQKRIEHAQ